MDTNINFTNDLNGESDCRISFNLPRKIYNLTAGRAVADGAIVVESESCTYETMLNIDRARLLNEASLLLLPNTYKEGKLYSHKPLNGNGDFTATRATTATRVNSAGLVDLVPYNLFTWSEMFTNALWTKTATSVTANTTTAPDGTLTADTLSVGIDASNQRHRLFNLQTFQSGTPYTYSIYLKQNQFRWVQIIGQAAFNAADWCNFDLQDGVIGNNGGGFISQTITSAGNGWWRISVTTTAISSVTSDIDVVVTTNGTDSGRYPSWQSLSAVDCYYVWGAQLVEGTSARDYLRTETRLNIPRVDYSLGGCPNILLEPQRTNLALQSSSFDNATWVKSATTITANTTTSPSGVVDADTLTANGLLLQHQCQQAINTTSGVAYTISFYLKKDTNNFAQIFGSGAAFGVNAFANFDLNNGVLGSVGSGITAAITSVGNGWFRCSITATATATISGSFSVFLVTSATATRAETNTLTTSFFLWGAQLEAGAYATSYIPTTTASVTRNLDVVQDLGVSSLIGQTEGTIYWEGTLTSGQTDDIFCLNRSVTNSVFLYKTTTNNIFLRVYYGGATFTISNATAYTGLVKIAAAYKSGDSVLYINGVQVGTSATAFTFTGSLNDVVLNNTAFLFGNATKSVKELALFQTRLTNSQLAALTA